jgi:hypothetical protein
VPQTEPEEQQIAHIHRAVRARIGAAVEWQPFAIEIEHTLESGFVERIGQQSDAVRIDARRQETHGHQREDLQAHRDRPCRGPATSRTPPVPALHHVAKAKEAQDRQALDMAPMHIGPEEMDRRDRPEPSGTALAGTHAAEEVDIGRQPERAENMRPLDDSGRHQIDEAGEGQEEHLEPRPKLLRRPEDQPVGAADDQSCQCHQAGDAGRLPHEGKQDACEPLVFYVTIGVSPLKTK